MRSLVRAPTAVSGADAGMEGVMATITCALPVLPGKAERVRRFQSELEPLRAAYDELNRQATVTRHEVYLPESPQGDLAITIMEADDPRLDACETVVLDRMIEQRVLVAPREAR